MTTMIISVSVYFSQGAFFIDFQINKINNRSNDVHDIHNINLSFVE